ncbi:MAG: Crp/Fnr family transcriptional regulator [Bacteroidota bacterium]
MFQQIEAYIRKAVPGNGQGINFVLTHFKVERAKARTLLFQPGDICRHCYFINKGCLQIYQLDSKGDMQTRDIILENNFVTSLDSFLHAKPSLEGFKALETCDLLTISRDSFLQLNETVPEFARIYKSNLENYFAGTVQKINSLMAMNTDEKVRWLFENRPDLLTRISNKVVASYLGIAPATLSRAKARLFKTLT